MTREEATCIAEEFQKELEDLAEKYGVREFLDISVKVNEEKIDEGK